MIERAAQRHLYGLLATGGDLPRPVLPSVVSDYVDGVEPDADGAIAEALRTQLPLRRLYQHLLRHRCVAAEIEQAAAAGGPDETVKLVLDHATLQLREVVSGGDRWLLRLLLDEDVRTEHGAPVLHLDWDDGVDRIAFPEVIDGMAQYILAGGDPRLARIVADAARRRPATRYRLVL